MCWNKEISLISFLIITLSSISLINYGNSKKYKKQNKIVGYYILFVGFMQLIDYLIWIDLKCDKGTNKIAGYLGPLLNYMQPIILLLLILYNTNNFSITTITEKLIIIILILYFIIILLIYYFYLKKNKICSFKNNKNHLSWSWNNEIWNILYFPASLLVIYLLYYYNYSIIPALLGYILLLISIIFFNQNIAELWCFFVVIIPLFEIIRQYILNYLKN